MDQRKLNSLRVTVLPKVSHDHAESAGRALLCLLAGSIFTLGLAPRSEAPVPRRHGPLALALTGQSWRPSLLLGWCFGLGFFGAGVSWVYVSINVYGHATRFSAHVNDLILRRTGASIRHPSSCPRCLDPLNSRYASSYSLASGWLSNGFELGCLQLPLAIRRICSAGYRSGWMGTSRCAWGVLAIRSASGVAEIMVDRRASGGITLASWIMLIAGAGYLLSSVHWTEPTGEARKVAIYQPNIALEDTWDRNNAPILLNDFWSMLRLMRPRLISWFGQRRPAFYFDQAPGYMSELRRIASNNEGTIVTGMPTRAGNRRFNSIVSVGQSSQTYNKQKLVPFGEFVPLEESLRGVIDFFDLPMSNFSKGDASQLPLSSNLGSLAPFICYEIVYPDFVAKGSHSSTY